MEEFDYELQIGERPVVMRLVTLMVGAPMVRICALCG